jgi:methylglutamate dehydrogenase subunit D
MPETKIVSTVHTRELPVSDSEARGRFGTGTEKPGSEITIINAVSTVLVIARRRKKRQLEEAVSNLKGMDVRWAGADQFFVMAVGQPDGEVESIVRKKVGEVASVVDQSHGRVVFQISGEKARDILAKGTPVDLRDERFPVGKSALTQIAHIGAHLTRVAQDSYQISVFRGFSESFMDWLKSQSKMYGVAIS